MTQNISLPPISDIFHSPKYPEPHYAPHSLHLYAMVSGYPPKYPYYGDLAPRYYDAPPAHYSAPVAVVVPRHERRFDVPTAAPAPPFAYSRSRSLVVLDAHHSVSSASSAESTPTSGMSSPGSQKMAMASKVRTRNNLPKETTHVLLKWLKEHLNHPYPNSFEKTQLMMTTGLNQQQLSNWFINARRRKIKALRLKPKDA